MIIKKPIFKRSTKDAVLLALTVLTSSGRSLREAWVPRSQFTLNPRGNVLEMPDWLSDKIEAEILEESGVLGVMWE